MCCAALCCVVILAANERLVASSYDVCSCVRVLAVGGGRSGGPLVVRMLVVGDVGVCVHTRQQPTLDNVVKYRQHMFMLRSEIHQITTFVKTERAQRRREGQT